MTSWIRLQVQRLRAVSALVRLAADPKKTHLVFVIGDSLYKLGAFEATLQRLNSNPADRAVIESRKTLELKSLAELKDAPEGSLGDVFYRHMTIHQLALDFYEKRAIENDATFVMMHMRQTHDLWHVVTGFKTDVGGELALQAFMLSQLSVPLSVILVGGALLKVGLKSPELISEAVDSIRKGIVLGSKAQSLFSYDWAANWRTPLDQVRAQLGIDLKI